jgi:hypothetical protein
MVYQDNLVQIYMPSQKATIIEEEIAEVSAKQ